MNLAPDVLWRRFVGRTADSATLADLLFALHAKWTPGTFAAEVARALRLQHKDPLGRVMPLDLREITALDKTVRIDAVIPLTILRPANVTVIADELLHELDRLKFDVPPKDACAVLRDEISLCYLALLHHRDLLLASELKMRLEIQCPSSPFSGRRKEILLMGLLPFGGRNTVFITALRPGDPGIEHAAQVTAVRLPDGTLALTELEGQ